MPGQLNDLARSVPALPIGNGLPSANTSDFENVDRHGDAHVPHADIHSPVPHRVIGNLIREQWQPHTPSPNRSNAAEQLGNAAVSAIKFKPLTQGKFAFRPTAVTCPTLGRAA